MNRVQKSFRDNLEHIKQNLPEEFHANLEAAMNEAKEYSISAEQEAEAIRAELRANPDVDDAALLPNLDTNAHRAPAQLSVEAEFDAVKAELKANPDVDDAAIIPNMTAPGKTPLWR